ncbi:MAG: rhodanese-like domain-containing protein, partial [Verrucomicrobiales bacterium]|nr:rhodanese-like domain-containing protein [Verrucomicrobiales bacterium]
PSPPSRAPATPSPAPAAPATPAPATPAPATPAPATPAPASPAPASPAPATPAPATPAPAAPESAAATQVDHVDAAGAAKLLAGADKPVVLDIRTAPECAAGHIDGATMIDFRAPDFESKVAALDRNKSYLVHCQGGGRSTESLATFKKLGFKHIIHLDGGFGDWEAAGNPVKK